jgi:excisionase family DNA binding protein
MSRGTQSDDQSTRADQRSIAPVLLTVSEACAALRISRWKFQELIRRRQVETIKIGARRLVPATALHDLVGRLRDEEQF